MTLYLLLSLLLLLFPAYVLFRSDRRLLRQSAIVTSRFAVTLAVLAGCLHYLFLWDAGWLNLLWVWLSGGVAIKFYCRKQWLFLPIGVAVTLSTLLVGLVVLLFVRDAGTSLLHAPHFLPLMAVLQACALYVSRRGLTTYVLNRRQHDSLNEYLLGNGVPRREALRPFVTVAIKRAFVPVLSQLLLAGVVFVPFVLAGMLLGGVAPARSVVLTVLLTTAALCCALLSLLLSIRCYNMQKQLTSD